MHPRRFDAPPAPSPTGPTAPTAPVQPDIVARLIEGMTLAGRPAAPQAPQPAPQQAPKPPLTPSLSSLPFGRVPFGAGQTNTPPVPAIPSSSSVWQQDSWEPGFPSILPVPEHTVTSAVVHYDLPPQPAHAPAHVPLVSPAPPTVPAVRAASSQDPLLRMVSGVERRNVLRHPPLTTPSGSVGIGGSGAPVAPAEATEVRVATAGRQAREPPGRLSASAAVADQLRVSGSSRGPPAALYNPVSGSTGPILLGDMRGFAPSRGPVAHYAVRRPADTDSKGEDDADLPLDAAQAAVWAWMTANDGEVDVPPPGVMQPTVFRTALDMKDMAQRQQRFLVRTRDGHGAFAVFPGPVRSWVLMRGTIRGMDATAAAITGASVRVYGVHLWQRPAWGAVALCISSRYVSTVIDAIGRYLYTSAG